MHQHVAFLQRIADKLERLLKMRGHLVTRQVDGVDDLVTDLLCRRVTDTQHRSCGQHYNNNPRT